MNTAETQVEFGTEHPLRTRCGWPARLVGTLQRRSNPNVVAVWNPNFKSEELHVYANDGRGPTSTGEHPLDLVGFPDEACWSRPSPVSST